MSTLTIVQIILGILSIIGILIQNSSTGIEGALGGGSANESIRLTKRGPEKAIFRGTALVVIAFIVISVLQIIQ